MNIIIKSWEERQRIVARTYPPESLTVLEVSKLEDVNITTLYAWKKKLAMKSGEQTPEISNEKKLHIIVETYTMNEIEKSEYCRKNGIFVRDIIQWKSEFITPKINKGKQQNGTSNEELKKVKHDLNKSNRELRRKEKALAEFAALLVLEKKIQAIWGDQEEE